MDRVRPALFFGQNAHSRVQMTRDIVLFLHLYQRRLLVDASLMGIGTPSVKSASRRRIHRTGNLSTDHVPSPFRFRIGYRHRGDKCLSIRVERQIDNTLSRPKLHHLTQVEDSYAIRDVFGERDIVRDEQNRGLRFPDEVNHEIDYLSSDRHIQHGDRLVRDNKARTHDKSASNSHPLSLTRVKFQIAQNPKWLCDNFFDDHTRVERLERILKHDLHLPTKRLHLTVRKLGNVPSKEDDSSSRRGD